MQGLLCSTISSGIRADQPYMGTQDWSYFGNGRESIDQYKEDGEYLTRELTLHCCTGGVWGQP